MSAAEQRPSASAEDKRGLISRHTLVASVVALEQETETSIGEIDLKKYVAQRAREAQKQSRKIRLLLRPDKRRILRISPKALEVASEIINEIEATAPTFENAAVGQSEPSARRIWGEHRTFSQGPETTVVIHDVLRLFGVDNPVDFDDRFRQQITGASHISVTEYDTPAGVTLCQQTRSPLALDQAATTIGRGQIGLIAYRSS